MPDPKCWQYEKIWWKGLQQLWTLDQHCSSILQYTLMLLGSKPNSIKKPLFISDQQSNRIDFKNAEHLITEHAGSINIFTTWGSPTKEPGPTVDMKMRLCYTSSHNAQIQFSYYFSAMTTLWRKIHNCLTTVASLQLNPDLQSPDFLVIPILPTSNFTFGLQYSETVLPPIMNRWWSTAN